MMLRSDRLFDLADTISLRLKVDGDKCSVMGKLQWTAPWGETIDLVNGASLRVLPDGTPHVMLWLPGHAAIYAAVTASETILAVIDTSSLGARNFVEGHAGAQNPSDMLQYFFGTVAGSYRRKTGDRKWLSFSEPVRLVQSVVTLKTVNTT